MTGTCTEKRFRHVTYPHYVLWRPNRIKPGRVEHQTIGGTVLDYGVSREVICGTECGAREATFTGDDPAPGTEVEIEAEPAS